MGNVIDDKEMMGNDVTSLMTLPPFVTAHLTNHCVVHDWKKHVYQGFSESKKKIGGNHAFIRDHCT